MEYQFLVEGETEKSFIKRQFIGKVVIINLWDSPPRKIETVSRQMNKNKTHLYIVFDTDKPRNIESFNAAIYTFKKNCQRLFILQQTRNFEEELSRACNCTKAALFSLFGASGADNFKKKFIADSNCLNKLSNNGFNLDILWNQPLIAELDHLKGYQSDGARLNGNRAIKRGG